MGVLLAAAGVCCVLLASVLPPKEQTVFRMQGREDAWRLATPEQETPGPDAVQINLADAEALTKLQGIGPALGQMIVEERERNGVFFFPEDLIAVKGIGLKKLAGFREMLDMRADESGER